MSIATQITRISGARDRIRAWLVGMGKVSDTATIDQCADAIDTIKDSLCDTSDGNMIAGHLVEGEIGYADGQKIVGTMKNNAATNKVLTVADPTFTIPQGYHDGSGDVMILPESKSVTPTASEQTVTASATKVLSEVKVAAIPDTYVLAAEVEAQLSAI